ncbi:MAG TPA: PDZ domain-containing protein [Thermoanaerobaculia bacterium]|nr:PDZ domain-containing protein [Thermoanaerobaculia bacterium]
MRSIRVAFFLSLAHLATAVSASAIDTRDTRLLTDPAVSKTHLAFTYANDLWVANLDGSAARRLTSHPGREARPGFSPDGRLLAFSGEYDGNVDVYTIPIEGGLPQRRTWHPSDDVFVGFTPDGSKLLFFSDREAANELHLFALPLAGGLPERLPLPNAFDGTYSPDGTRMVYNPLPPAFRQWKNYRGGTHSRLWIVRWSDLGVTMIPQPAGRSNDHEAMWIGETIYFLSDRAGEFNLWSYDPRTEALEQLTHHEDFPVLLASAGGGKIVYEQAGSLHLFDPATKSAKRLTLGVAADLPDLRPRWAGKPEHVRDMDLSPSGARVALEFRGEIFTAPAAKGDPRNLTRTPGAHERSPAWSPDGKTLAYFSDASGEYQLHLESQDGKGAVRALALAGSGFYESPIWSPDSKKIAFQDNSRTLYWLDVATGKQNQVAALSYYGPLNTLRYAWAPDSQWIAYTLESESLFQTVWIHSLPENRSYPITDGLSDAGEPVFDASGKYLWLLASTDAGPLRQWFDMSNVDAKLSNTLYLIVLAKGEPSPLARESDEEKGKEESKKDGKDEKAEEAKPAAGKKAGKGKEAAAEPAKSDEPKPVKIDFEGIGQRILALPVAPAFHFGLAAGKEGEVYYLRYDEDFVAFGAGPSKLIQFQLKEKKENVLAEGILAFEVAPGGAKLVARTETSLSVVDAGAKLEGGNGAVDLKAIQVWVEPEAEWRQIFEEAWRINRDYFYDPGMHGADWPAMRKKYEVFLPHLSCRADLNRVLQWMASELAVGHHFIFGGERAQETKKVPGGLLGADLEVHEGRYRFKKVLGGLNWNPDLRSPLTEPGVDVVAGEYLLAVEGENLAPPDSPYRPFEGKAGKNVEITVGPKADGSGSRTVTVVPIEREGALRVRDWVEGNLRRVNEATGGRVAYVWVPDTTLEGHVYFKRYFFPQAHKQAIILDERFNGGGQIADYYIDVLRRPYLSHWATRYGKDLKTPKGSIQGPKVMLINEQAGSGGDLLPWMFRKHGVGKLIGRPTWGGLVGILGFPVLMDGGRITAPNVAIWTEEGFVVENVGVPPDIEVEMLPAEAAKGRDPQLEKAIEVILAELAANPPQEPKKPPFPVRVRKP